MRILVTGATGRIGHNFVAELLMLGHEVRALVLPGDPQRGRIEKPGVEIVEGLLTDRASLDPAVNGVDAVYHLGALMPQNVTADALFETNIRGTYNLLEAVAPHAGHLKRFVMASTDNVYYTPQGALYLPIDENHPRMTSDPYGMSKVVCEDMCWNYMRQYGLKVAMPRFGVTMECHELLDPKAILASRTFLKAILAARANKPNPTADDQKLTEELERLDADGVTLIAQCDPQGNFWMEGINDARNVAEGLPLFLEKDCAVGDVFHLSAPHVFTHDEYVKYVSKITGWKYAEVVFPSVFRWGLSIAKARAMLGYNPTRDVFQMIDEGWEIMKQRLT
jgi:UDP-glucose 4-epimerase